MQHPRTRRVVFAIALLSLVAVPAEAQSGDPRSGERYALLVGVRQYYATDLRELDYAEADVTDLAGVFLGQGYRPENVVLMTLTNGARNVRRLPMADRIRHELALLLRGRGPEGSVIVALAGHGIKPRGSTTSYFCPIDANLDDLGSLISLDELYKDLEGCGAGFKLLLVDACRNDPLLKVSRGRPKVELESVTRPDVATPPGGVVALFSCSAGEVAFEHPDLRHGVFFHFVIEGLRGSAARPSDGRITLPLLEDYVKDHVERFVREKFDVRQMPERLGHDAGSMTLASLDRHMALRPVLPGAPATGTNQEMRRSSSRVPGSAIGPILTVRPSDQTTARLVVSLLEKRHLAKPRIDDQVARKWAERFFKVLDPKKLYFERPDIDEFMSQAALLDDQVKEGKLDFAVRVFERYLRRIDERLTAVLTLVGETPDFSVDESIDNNFESRDYPSGSDEARERWRKQIKLDRLQLKVDGVEDREAVRRITVRYRDWNRAQHQCDMSDLLATYLTSLVQTIDPNSYYLAPKALEDMEQGLRMSLEGIGAALQIEDGYAVVQKIVPGSASDEDGRLQVGDRIVGVQQPDGTEIDLIEKKLSDIVRTLRGPRGTKVRIVVQPEGTSERRVYELTRERVDDAEAHARGQVVEVPTEDGKALKIGVIKLPSFYGNAQAVQRGDPDAVSATRDCRRLLEGFQRQGVAAVVLDLRGNGGGLISEALSLSGLFLDGGPVVQVRLDSGVKQFDDPEEETVYTGPLVIVIDRSSAAASEIVTGMIEDYGRGLVIGGVSTTCLGKVAEILKLNEQPDQPRGAEVPKFGALRVTTQQLYRVDGKGIQGRGVFPHIHIHSLRDVFEPGEGLSEHALGSDDVAPVPHDQYNLVPPDLVANLESRSRGRRADNAEFLKEDERIRRYLERKARRVIPLNEARYRAEWLLDDEPSRRDGLNASGAGVKKSPARKPVWESGANNDEVLAITADYVTLGSGIFTAPPVRAPAAYTLINGDGAHKLFIKDEATGADIVLAPGASQSHSFPARGSLLFFSIPASRDPKVWKRHQLKRGGTLRFQIVNGVWVPNPL